MDFFAECKTEPGSEVFLLLLQPLSLRPSVFQLYSHLFAQIHFLDHTLLNGHSITLFQLFYHREESDVTCSSEIYCQSNY